MKVFQEQGMPRRFPLFADAAPVMSGTLSLPRPHRPVRSKKIAEEEGKSTAFNLVSKILIVSGLLFCVVGAFLILFVNTVVGIVMLIVGISDLVMSFVLPRVTTGESG
jgi:hypothetical protein